MQTTVNRAGKQAAAPSVSLADVRRIDCLGLSIEAMQAVGAAAQTLAAMRRLASEDGKMFACRQKIADAACLSEATVKRHVATLVAEGWVRRRGREERRSVTYRLASEVMNRQSEKRFALLPRWAARMLPRWSDRAVFAAVVSRDSLAGWIEEQDLGPDDGGDACDLHGRRQFSERKLAETTGLTTRAIRDAKARLSDGGLITIDPAMIWQDEFGRLRTVPDTIFLNREYPVPLELLESDSPTGKNDPRPPEKMTRAYRKK